MLLFVKRLFISSRCHSKWKIFGGWYPNAFLKYISTDQEKGISQHTICWRYSYFSYYFISKLKLGICHFHVWSSIFRDLAFSVDILIEVKRCKYMPNEPINNYWMRLRISWIGLFTVVSLVTWPLNGSEAGVDLVLIQTSLLLLCKSSCSYAK